MGSIGMSRVGILVGTLRTVQGWGTGSVGSGKMVVMVVAAAAAAALTSRLKVGCCTHGTVFIGVFIVKTTGDAIPPCVGGWWF